MSIFLSLLIRQRYPDRRLQLSWLNATKVLISSDQTSARYLKLRWLFMCIYQSLFHFGSPLPGILTRPLLCSGRWRIQRYRARPWLTILLLGGCVRGEAAPVPTAAPRRWVYCVVATSRVSPVYRSSARSPQRPDLRLSRQGH